MFFPGGKTVREVSIAMDKVTFGLTLLVVGMGGTLLTLWLLTLVMRLLVRLFPEHAAHPHSKD